VIFTISLLSTSYRIKSTSRHGIESSWEKSDLIETF
jgi:hypothetical protein